MLSDGFYLTRKIDNALLRDTSLFTRHWQGVNGCHTAAPGISDNIFKSDGETWIGKLQSQVSLRRDYMAFQRKRRTMVPPPASRSLKINVES